MGFRRRISRLEDEARGGRASLTPEGLALLSDEDLDALEATTEAAVERGDAPFEDLNAVVTEQSRRALADYLEAIEALQRGEELPEDRFDDVPRNAYRIWKHYRKENLR